MPRRPRALLLSLVAVVTSGASLLAGCGSQSPTFSSRIPAISNGSPSQLGWIHTTSQSFVDQSGAKIILRGFVTIPSGLGTPGDQYTPAAYAKMRSLGANYQSIRITAGELGYGRGGAPASGYLQELVNMVQWAAQQGIYTDFKLVPYDVPNWSWTSFWKDSNGEQAAWIKAYSYVWRTFKNDPSVVGYDLLNEPHMGAVSMSAGQFEATYLNPFYEKAIAALRQLDPRHIAFFQPLEHTSQPSYPYVVPLHGSELSYAVHFYPKHPRYKTKAFLPLMRRYLAEARRSGVPLMIGEFGSPWNVRANASPALYTRLERLEESYYTLFLRYGLSYSRPWWANDQVIGPARNGQHVTWAVVASNSSLTGPLRPWIAIPFADAAKQLLSQQAS
jgi:hypothetical protein